MFNKEAIQELAKAQAITAAMEAVGNESESIVALPDTFKIHDLEPFLLLRRRQRATMTTQTLADFSTYVAAQRETGTSVFVSAEGMRAIAVLNLGTPTSPGHCDHLAIYAPPKTAPYTAMTQVANGYGMAQLKLAEFLEDWSDFCGAETYGEDGETVPMTLKKAVQAIRRISIDSSKKQESTVGQHTVELSVFEKVAANAKDQPLPAVITFKCIPHLDLKERTFKLRLGLITGDKPALTLRVVNAERHVEEMGQELCALVRGAIGDTPVIAGWFAATR
jgi:uncharacterized protein YfdQ (DUF2303 family)